MIVKERLSDELFFEGKDSLFRGFNYIVALEYKLIKKKLIPMINKKLPKNQVEQDEVIRDYLISLAELDNAINYLKNESTRATN